MLATMGVRHAISSKSSMESSTPASRAIASRWSTAFVEPAVAATPAMAFSNASRVMMSRGVVPLRRRSIASLPAFRAASAFASKTAGTAFAPAGLMPRNSSAIAIVFAVNCPPHAPAPGQAWSSTAFSRASSMRPAPCAPTASNTSRMVMSLPSSLPGKMEPL